MHSAFRPIVLVLSLALLVPALAADPGGAQASSPVRIARWESNLSIGGVTNGRLGIVKSFWWYAVPKVVAVGLSFDYIAQVIPLSVGISLSAPIPVVIPFICASAGTSLTVGGISAYGAGLRIRLGSRFGLVAEYRKYHYSHDTEGNPGVREKAVDDYFGAGIAWIY